MSEPYLDNVHLLRQAFPSPVSDRVHDAYFVYSCSRALDQVDELKSNTPMLGEPGSWDYSAARRKRMAPGMQSLEDVTGNLVDYLSGMFIWGHPNAQINVVPAPTIPSIIGGLLPSIYNPNLCSDETGRRIALAEVETIAMSADLVGYDPAIAGGLFTFGGTGTLLYGAKIGLEKACPGTVREGVREPAYLLCSGQAHYACMTVANWLGLGEQNVIQVPTTLDNEVRTCLLESHLRELLKQKKKIACIVATMGTTDAFGLDDLEAIVELRNDLVEEYHLDYIPHIHADAVIGWAWSVFNDYDFKENPLGFRRRTIRALAGTQRRIQHLHLSDSLGIDFHKTGFTPYISSAFLAKDANDLQRISRDESATPYLFQSGHHHPGKYTLETSRSGSGPMAALANLKLFGIEGLQSLLGHLVNMAETLRDHIDGDSAMTVLNRGNFGPVTLFRVYPDGVDTFSVPEKERTESRYREQLKKHNDYNRRIFEIVHEEALQGRGVVISMTDCYRHSEYGEPINALKSYILSPFSDDHHVDSVLESLNRARQMLAQDSSSPKSEH